MANAVRQLRTKLRDFALGLPEAHEDMPWGERVVKVKKKVFVFLGLDRDPDQFRFSVKLPESRHSALALPFCSPTGYGLGKSGWVSAKLEQKEQLSFAELRDWVLESYRAVAPKSLAARVSQLVAKATKKTTKKTTTKKATTKKATTKKAITKKAAGKSKSPARRAAAPKKAPKR